MKVDRRLLAYHEAGHAVASLLKGAPFSSVTIEGDEYVPGRCVRGGWPAGVRPDLHVTPRTRRYVEAAIVSLLGGRAGQQVGARRALTCEEAQATVDWQNAFHNSGRLTTTTRAASAYMDWLWVYTQDLLEDPPHRHAVAVLARALQRDGTLSGRRARALINDEINAWPRRRTPIKFIDETNGEVDAT